VHVRILTNSLASTDSPLVYTGYRRYRVGLLKLGVDLREMRPKLGQKRPRFHPFQSSNASLHAKALVIDQKTVFIGSLNMDGRSKRFNSEMGLVIRSTDIARQVTNILDDLSADGSYRLSLLDHTSDIEWLSGEAGDQQVWHSDPETTVMQRVTLRALAPFEDALVDRNVPVALDGEGTLFERHDVLDALAVAWSAVDPFAHAWLLRALQLPAFGLDDASLALLCGEPSSAQALLFDLPVDEAQADRRWDRKRDLRLGTNVVRGDRDADLGAEARARLEDFRVRRARWQTLLRAAPEGVTLARIAADAGLDAPRHGETAARVQRRRALIDALATAVERVLRRSASDDLSRALTGCERLARTENGPLLQAGSGVAVAAIERIKWRRFAHVFVVDLRAGSFPPYYVPDAFLFSPVYGMIAKDNVGEATTSRTVKFTWYQHHAKLRETYSREDRRALAVALGRADETVTLSASGKPTRGVAAPELLAEVANLLP